ncbi:unnamed protein product, partial [Ascophyllum nodosum]
YQLQSYVKREEAFESVFYSSIICSIHDVMTLVNKVHWRARAREPAWMSNQQGKQHGSQKRPFEVSISNKPCSNYWRVPRLDRGRWPGGEGKTLVLHLCIITRRAYNISLDDERPERDMQFSEYRVLPSVADRQIDRQTYCGKRI